MVGARGLFATSVIMCAVTAVPAAAQVRTFDIPAQPAGSGIAQLGRQADVQIGIARKDARGKRTNAVRGGMTVEDALRRLLKGTGLNARRTGEQTYTVVPFDSASATPAAPATIPEVALASVATSPDNAEIVVTAQKRAERLIDTPQSVTVVSSLALTRLAATQFRDFANTVPGLTFDTAGAGQTQITLRGVTSGWDVSPTVGIYVDDIPYGSSSAFAQGSSIALDVGLFDVDHVEVLRGPQGTIYGASTLGGLIKYVTISPQLHGTEVELRAGVGSTEHGGMSYDGAAAINVPLGRTAALRGSGFYSRDAGYIDNVQLGAKDVNAADIYGGRLDLLFKPTDALTVRLGAFAQNVSRDGTAIADYTMQGQPSYGDLTQRRAIPESFDQRFRLVSGTVSYDFGPGTATSISSYQSMNARQLTDFSAAYVPYFNSDPGTFGGPYSVVGLFSDVLLRKFTQELRVASNGRRRLEWLAGAFYTVETVRSDEHMVLHGPAGQTIAPDQLYVRSEPSQYREIAGFLNLTYRFSDAFDVGGGIRLAHNSQRNEVIGRGLFALSTPKGRSHENVATYLVDARYHFSPNATAYARFATGYRPGGPNSINYDPSTGKPFGLPTFKADSLKSYELGFKGQTTDRRFAIDASAYHIDWRDIQIIAVRNGFGVVANAPSARIDGAELSLTGRPSSTLEFSGAFAYQNARLAENAPDLGGVKGERLPAVPRLTAAITGDYTARNSALRPSVGATLRFVSTRDVTFGRASGNPTYVLPSYAMVDLRAGVRVHGMDVGVYLRNLFDERAQLGARTYAIAGGPNQVPVSILQPRTVGLNVGTHF